ncbi:ThuA domain-containing protein [Bacteroidota bacterium]
MKLLCLYILFFLLTTNSVFCYGQVVPEDSEFKVLVISEDGGHHLKFTQEARVWLNKLGEDRNFAIDYICNPHIIEEKYLEEYRLIIQLDYPPYNWGDKAKYAFQQYIENGKGGWIGFHHATLLGEFDGFPMWTWYSEFMGNIQFKDYIADLAQGMVMVEDRNHPCMKGLPSTFTINDEEWYTYDKSPRGQVKVLASVDESSYKPSSDKKMGYHPVVWTNTEYPARNIYIFMGHSPNLFQNKAYTRLFQNAIFWAAGKKR